jgi:hypothetical protein
MKKAAIGLILVLGLGGGVGYLATGGFSTSASSNGVASAPAMRSQIAESGGVAVGVPAGSADKSGAPVSAPPAPATGGGGSSVIGTSVPAVGPEIVKTAELSVEVKKDTFQDQFTVASNIAQKYGGFVESSSTSQGDRSRSGTLLIRVPNASFEAAMTDLRNLGTPDGESTSGTDVSSQFVDLEARLRTWEAQEAVFLRLMNKAHSINATLQIQRQLQDVQMQIEQIKGELQQLHDQTRMATINVTLHEPGVAIPQPQPVSDRPNLGEAWSKAVDGLLGVLYTTVIGLGYLIPIGALLAIGLYAWRRIGVRQARPAERSAPAA